MSAAVVLGLLAGALGLGVAGSTRGPRLDSGSVNTETAVLRAGQRIVLTADQPLASTSAAGVTVAPVRGDPPVATLAPVEASATVDGADLVITLGRPLRYGTEYRVDVPGAEALYTGNASTLDFLFETPGTTVYTLLRSPAGGDEVADDTVIRHAVDEPGRARQVYAAPRIQDFVVVDTLIAAVLVEPDGRTRLQLASLEDPASSPVEAFVPPGGVVRDLRSSSAQSVGYQLDGGVRPGGGVYANAVFVYDLRNSSGVPVEATGPGGQPLPVADWFFVPGSTAIVAQASDGQLWLLDPIAGREPTPLGQHTELRNLLPGTTDLVVADPGGGTLLDLSSGSSEPLDLPVADVPAELFPGPVEVLDRASYLRRYDDIRYTASSTSIESRLVLVDGAGTSDLFRPASDGGRLREYCLSPNGQYAAVEVVSADAAPDGFAEEPAFDGMLTYLVDVTDGRVAGSLDGFLPSWCRGA